jgi:hypothetical protein
MKDPTAGRSRCRVGSSAVRATRACASTSSTVSTRRFFDGFNEAIATSARFTALGAPPVVSILSPVPRTRVSAGSALDLAGLAYADTGTPLSGQALTWRAGRVVLGHGTMLATTTLPAGRHRLTLTARDRFGRVATTAMAVTITPAAPVVTRLTIPRRVSRRARSVTIRIATLTPVTVTVGRRGVVIGRALTALRLPVRPGRKAVRIVLVLRSGRFTLPVPVIVAR